MVNLLRLIAVLTCLLAQLALCAETSVAQSANAPARLPGIVESDDDTSPVRLPPVEVDPRVTPTAGWDPLPFPVGDDTDAEATPPESMERTPDFTAESSEQPLRPTRGAVPDDGSLYDSAGYGAERFGGDAEQVAALGKLEKSVAALAKNLTVTTASPCNRLVVGGAIEADFLYNSARPVAPGIPFYLTPASPLGLNQDTFDAHARQTTLFAALRGPSIGSFEVGGFVLAMLENDALIVDRYGLLPIQAFGELKNEWWRFAAGLQTDIFNPVIPTILPFSLLGASGNTGAFRGQARVERFFHLHDESQITVTGGISDPLPTTVDPTFRISEDNGWPNVEGRVAWGLGPMQQVGLVQQRPIEFGISGVVGQIRTTRPRVGRVIANVRGLGVDMRARVTPRFGVLGELFVGQTLGTYMGGILENVNDDTFNGIRAAGCWGEAYYYVVPDCVHVHSGYGFDNPRNIDLAPTQPQWNGTWFGNVIWDVNPFFRLACEITHRHTEYVALSNSGVGVQTQAMWKF